MANERYFFTTKPDLIQIITNVEQIIELKYVKTGSHNSNDIKVYDSFKDYENIGIHTSGEHQSQSFLVLDKNEKLSIEEKDTTIGKRYLIDQKMNENSVVFWPGGIYNGEFLICGHMGTIHKTTKSQELFNIFQKVIKKECSKKIGRYYIGNDALKQYGKMRFITINVKQSVEYDVKI